MCQKLAELEKAMGAFASGFDPALISAAQAEGVMERAARIEHMAATVKGLAAVRMCETELWELGGDKSTPHMRSTDGSTTSGRCATGPAPTGPGSSRPRARPRLGTDYWH